MNFSNKQVSGNSISPIPFNHQSSGGSSQPTSPPADPYTNRDISLTFPPPNDEISDFILNNFEANSPIDSSFLGSESPKSMVQRSICTPLSQILDGQIYKLVCIHSFCVLEGLWNILNSASSSLPT